MPYASLADLPVSVKDALPKHGQEIFRAAFNSAYEGTCADREDLEACSNAIAWTAVGQKYKKTDDKWVEISQKAEVHDAILQTLNREIGGYCFPVEPFTQSVSAWEGIPVVYANDHPDMKLFAENPTKALEAIKGEVVGQVSKPYIATEGHPRLMAGITNTNTDVAQLIKAGQASLSTGFMGAADKASKILKVTPNHVLLFKEDTENMPKDHGAFILNKEDYIEFTNRGEVMADETISDKIKQPIIDLYNAVMGSGKPPDAGGDDSHNSGKLTTEEVENMDEVSKLSSDLTIANKEIGDVTSKLDIANKEIEDLKTQATGKDGALEIVNKDIETHKATITGLETKVKEFEQKEVDALKVTRDAQWEEIKNKLPPGLTHTEDNEKALQGEFDTDPYTFSTKYVGIQNQAGRGESGEEFPTGDYASAEAEDLKAISEFNTRLGRG